MMAATKTHEVDPRAPAEGRTTCGRLIDASVVTGAAVTCQQCIKFGKRRAEAAKVVPLGRPELSIAPQVPVTPASEQSAGTGAGGPSSAASVRVVHEEGPPGYRGASEELRMLAADARSLFEKGDPAATRWLADRLLDLAGDLETHGESRRAPVRLVEMSGLLVRVEGLPREFTVAQLRRLYFALAAAAVDFEPGRLMSWS